MPFELRPASIDDVPTFAIIQREAFADDAIVGQLFKDVPESIRQERDVKWISTMVEQSYSNWTRLSKVVDTSNGDIAGFAKYDIPHAMTAEQKAERAQMPSKRDPLPEGANVPLCEDFFEQLDRKTHHWIDPEKDTYLHILVVRPKYHRLGLGTLLIKAGLAIADAARSKTYIIASPMGLPLYLGHGWQKVDEVVVDMRKYGGSHVVVEELLLREPGAEP